MSRSGKIAAVVAGLFFYTIFFPMVLLFSGLEEQVEETAVKCCNKPMAHYGDVAIAVFCVVWLVGAVLGARWIFKRRQSGN
jgi:hypothetical protein